MASDSRCGSGSLCMLRNSRASLQTRIQPGRKQARVVVIAMAILPLARLVAQAEDVSLLDHRALLEAQSFWDNRDFEWFEQNIPFLDTPDAELDTTYYYRWELVTKHLTYGSPTTGYLWTEFINRPFWSGAYGAISCPSGHQIYEARWLRNPRYVRDYLRYWFRTPGAQPRRYSAWMADSAWATHLVHPNRAFLEDLLPDLEENLAGWTARSWVEEAGMFWQVGHDDGMEFNIASRQTEDIVRGAPCYRPSFNSYMWADLRALASIAEQLGDAAKAKSYRDRAAKLKERVEEKLWDPKRQFFFPMFRDDERDREGNSVRKNTLIHQSGKFAGSPHGREIASYVPWAFNLPSPGFEDAWKFLMDPEYFYAERGPTTTERNDPLFRLEKNCCWWSGQSWPFATTQTLKAMAHLLHNYEQEYVTRVDYYRLLRNYALSHRKDGAPYIAEALHPDTGAWDGHDYYYRSEHYFHSGFTDLVITGLIGLEVADSDTLTIDPLVPEDWEFFALDEIPYRGHRVAVLWDRTGERYGKGVGLQVFVDGKASAASPDLGKLEVPLPSLQEAPLDARSSWNFAVNNDGDWFPRFQASHIGPRSSLAFLHDGNTAWYHLHPPLRWTSEGSGSTSDWVSVQLGAARRVDHVRLFLLDDGEGHAVAAPSSFELQYRDAGGTWKSVPKQVRQPLQPRGHRPNSIRFPEIEVSELRVVLEHREGRASGLTEFEVWGPAAGTFTPAPPPAGNVAFKPQRAGEFAADFPKVTASFHDRYGGVPKNAIDGRIVYAAHPVNRWTSYGSPNETSDWLALDFGKPQVIGRVVLHIYDDRGGVQAPKSYTVEVWRDGAWTEIAEQDRSPQQPKGSAANTVTFAPIEARKMRVVFTHIGKGDTRSGVTELEVWKR